jgi:16S rRNA (guanine966-N2)-methyltransferase
MRIIAGRYRSRKLKSVPGLLVRPTSDRLREALFSILAPRIEGVTFLDAYAGSGAVGIEALSRGAKHVVLIERSGQALEVIRENVATLKAGGEVTIVRGSATAVLRKYPAEIVFIDPPYDRVKEYAECLSILAEMGCPLAIAQHPSRLVLDEKYGRLEKRRVLKQGDNSLSFYEPAEEE